jgi:cation diffusion facilitator family transporter
VFGVRRSGRPADHTHAFGHGKFESFSGLVQAFLIFVAAMWIVREAVDKLLHPQTLENLGGGIGVMVISAGVNFVMARVLFSVATKTESLALKADGWHSLTDVYTSLGVFVGLGIIWVGKRVLPGVDLFWIDPVTAIVVSLLILKAAWDLGVECVPDLLDVRLPRAEEDAIRGIIREYSPKVLGFHDLRTRRAGAVRFAEVHIYVEAAMSVGESHTLQHAINDAINRRLPNTQVIMHVEPCDQQMG